VTPSQTKRGGSFSAGPGRTNNRDVTLRAVVTQPSDSSEMSNNGKLYEIVAGQGGPAVVPFSLYALIPRQLAPMAPRLDHLTSSLPLPYQTRHQKLCNTNTTQHPLSPPPRLSLTPHPQAPASPGRRTGRRTPGSARLSSAYGPYSSGLDPARPALTRLSRLKPRKAPRHTPRLPKRLALL
jgi:hypothetical protein